MLNFKRLIHAIASRRANLFDEYQVLYFYYQHGKLTYNQHVMLRRFAELTYGYEITTK